MTINGWYKVQTMPNLDPSRNIRQLIKHGNGNQSGWWYTYPSETYEFVSWEYEIPNIWKVIKFMFQTTNQSIIYKWFPTSSHSTSISRGHVWLPEAMGRSCIRTKRSSRTIRIIRVVRAKLNMATPARLGFGWFRTWKCCNIHQDPTNLHGRNMENDDEPVGLGWPIWQTHGSSQI